MQILQISSKIFSLGGEMWITDEAGNARYSVKGSFLKIPKSFTIFDAQENPVAKVTHQVISLLPKFFLEINGQPAATISKRFSLLKPKYDIEAAGVTVEGNIWDMNFQILREGREIGRIDKQWLSVRDKYQIQVENPADELMVLGLVLAIDYVRREEDSANNSVNFGG